VRLSFTCNSCIRLVQNLHVNQVSRSETIDSGSPWRRQISFTNVKASSLICSSVHRGMKCAILENLSTITHIFVYPSDFGNPTIKSMDIAVQGLIGTSKGSRSPYFLCQMTLLR